MHMVEKLWEPGGCLHREGSPELTSLVKGRERFIYRGKALRVVGELAEAIEEIPVKTPGNKGQRNKLVGIRDYLFNRIDRIELRLASGSRSGARLGSCGGDG
jgi:hypothetical protein